MKKKVFIFAINVSELFALNCFYQEHITFSLVVNVLTKSLKTLHVTTREFFQLIYVHNDQQIR